MTKIVLLVIMVLVLAVGGTTFAGWVGKEVVTENFAGGYSTEANANTAATLRLREDYTNFRKFHDDIIDPFPGRWIGIEKGTKVIVTEEPNSHGIGRVKLPDGTQWWVRIE